MDESSVQYGFHVLTKSEDEILADLAGRLLNRHLFRYETLTESRIPMIKKELAEKAWIRTIIVISTALSKNLISRIAAKTVITFGYGKQMAASWNCRRFPLLSMPSQKQTSKKIACCFIHRREAESICKIKKA